MRTAHIYDGSSNQYIKQVADGSSMERAVLKAIQEAKSLPQHTIHVRDCLGGLRAEVLKRDGSTVVKRN